MHGGEAESKQPFDAPYLCAAWKLRKVRLTDALRFLAAAEGKKRFDTQHRSLVANGTKAEALFVIVQLLQGKGSPPCTKRHPDNVERGYLLR